MIRVRDSFKAVYLVLMIAFLLVSANVLAECLECEVAKGKIPAQFLDKSVKILPSGIPVWDNEEAMAAMKNRDGKYLWVDTRPSSFIKVGTLAPAVNLVCDLKGVAIPASDAAHAISKDRLLAEMKAVDPDTNQVTVVFFCQGPKCHRSYDAAIRCVSEYGFAPENVVWFRDGYPNFETYIFDNPKYKKKMSRYLRGDVLNR